MGTKRLSEESERRFFDGLRFAGEFFMGSSNVQRAMEKLTTRLEDAGIAYAIVGAMALNEYGYRRVTEDVDVLLTREGLQQFRRLWLGKGYSEKFAGSTGLRDTENGVDIDVILTGDYPGDGKPKPVAFPDPETEGRHGGRVTLLPIESMIELKLASGMTAPHRLRDLADVLELIRAVDLPKSLAEELDASVRDKFLELWRSAHSGDSIHE